MKASISDTKCGSDWTESGQLANTGHSESQMWWENELNLLKWIETTQTDSRGSESPPGKEKQNIAAKSSSPQELHLKVRCVKFDLIYGFYIGKS